MVSTIQRDRFDDLLDNQIEALPSRLRELLEEVPLVVEDEPSDQLLGELGVDRRTGDLCGLHSGVPLTHRSVEAPPHVPDRMMLFRGPIMRLAGHRRHPHRHEGEDNQARGIAMLEDQIHVTLLHEIGHHFGLDEDDLAELGYG